MHTSIFSKAMRTRTTVATAALVAALGLGGCSPNLPGEAASYLIIESLQAASGSTPTQFADQLASDVLTEVSGNPTVISDNGMITVRLAMKNPGSSETPTEPSTTNFITVNRYSVRYTRVNGGGTPGVDVPATIEGAITGTVRDTSTGFGFTIVKAHAKIEAPLSGLAETGESIPTVAEVTLFGTDQAGKATSVKGSISITFADWK
jgi:hypothetical protein